jgi:hypothetical protein
VPGASRENPMDGGFPAASSCAVEDKKTLAVERDYLVADKRGTSDG